MSTQLAAKSEKWANFLEACLAAESCLCSAFVIRRLSLLFVAVLTFLPTWLEAIEPMSMTGNFTNDPKTGEFIATADASGPPSLFYDNALLVADELRYDPKTEIGKARGHASVTRGKQRIVADEITYRITDRYFTATHVRLGSNPLYLSADRIEGSLDNIQAKNVVASFHEPTPFAPILKARLLDYSRDRLLATDARLGIGGVMPVRLPHFQHGGGESLLSYVSLDAGYRGSLGEILSVGLHLPVLPDVKLGGDVSYFTKRGMLIGPSGSYDTVINGQEISGRLMSGFIRDGGNKLTDTSGHLISENRGFVDWQHYQRVNDHLTLLGQINYWSDSEIIRDFRPEDFFQVQVPDSYLEGVYTSQNYVGSAFVRVQPNPYQRMQQRLPDIHFDLLPTPIGAGIYERFNASVASLLQYRNPTTGDTLRSNRFNAFYSLTRPISPQDWLTFTPVAGGQLTYYARAIDGKDTYTRALGEIGLDAALHASGVYAFKNERWGIDGIRHLVTPNISYRYIPSANKGHDFIPKIDRLPFSTYLQPLDLGDERNIDDLQSTNTLRLGVDNTFQTRDKSYGSRDLLALNFAADLRFDHPPTAHNFSDVHVDLAFTPTHWFRFNVYQSFDPRNLNVRELNTGFTLSDTRWWSLRLSNHYLQGQIEEYITEGRYRLNELYDMYARFHYDARQSRFVEQSIGLHQNLDNLWIIQYGVSIYQGRRRESNFGFNIEVKLAAF